MAMWAFENRETKPLYSDGSCLYIDRFQLLGRAGACLSCSSHPCGKIPDKALKEEELIPAPSSKVQSSMMEKPRLQEHEVPGQMVQSIFLKYLVRWYSPSCWGTWSDGTVHFAEVPDQMVQSSMMEKPWLQEHEVPGHIASAVGKQKEMNTGVLSLIYKRPYNVAWDPNQ